MGGGGRRPPPPTHHFFACHVLPLKKAKHQAMCHLSEAEMARQFGVSSPLGMTRDLLRASPLKDGTRLKRGFAPFKSLGDGTPT